MDRDYLEDYEQSELEEHERFQKILINKEFGPTDIFPPRNRFVKITEPIAMFLHEKSELWPQVPFAGSTLVMLYPVRKELFKKVHSFEVSDINRLVDFTKETGKVQFVIDWPPTAYEGLDFLDPILTELKPPTNPWPSELWSLTEAQRKDAIIEFDALINVNFYRFIKELFSGQSYTDKHFLAKRIHDYRMDYLTLKTLNLQDILENLNTLIVDDPPRAYQWFIIIGAFFTLPLCNTFKSSINYSLDFLTEACRYVEVPNPSFPYEIGKFLIKKLIHYPESLTACQELVAHYKDYDLMKLMIALDEGIKKSEFNLVNATREKLLETLENIWSDATIQRKIEAIKFGIPLSLAALGTIAAGPIGAVGGLLTGLGFSVGSTVVKIKTDKLGERIAKSLSLSYQANIYDFKRKYKIE